MFASNLEGERVLASNLEGEHVFFLIIVSYNTV